MLQHLYEVLAAEGWLELQVNFEQVGDASLRAQMSNIWRFRGQVDWREFELPLAGLVPIILQPTAGGTIREVVIGQPSDHPIGPDALFGFTGCGSSWFVDSRVTRFYCQALSFNKHANMRALLFSRHSTINLL